MTRTILLFAALLAAACGESPAPPAPESASSSFAPVEPPTTAASGQPRFTTDGDRLFLSWVERTDSLAVLRFAAWNGAGWGEPREAARGTDWFVNWADTPGVIALGGDRFAAFYLQRTGARPYDYGIRVVRSEDGGASWSAPATPHRDLPAEYGFVSALPTPEGALRLVWLDGTETAGESAHGGEDGHHGGGAMRLMSSVIAPSGTADAPTLLDGRVCDCCPTAAAHTRDGLVVAYRGRSPDEIRDIAVVRQQDDAWTAPSIPHPDGWRIAGCPVNGPALAARDGLVALAWYTGQEGGRVQVAFSHDAGATFEAPVRLDAGKPAGRVDVALGADGSALVSWIEHAADGGELRLRRVAPDGTARPPLTAAAIDGGRGSGMPKMALHGDEVLLAWVDTGEQPGVRVASAPVTAMP